MTESIQTPSTTALTSLHIENGAKMVPFANYIMPVQYPMGVKAEHLHTRSKTGLFDVSHMGQVVITGSDADDALEKIIPVDIKGLKVGEQCYGFLTNAQGGIEDDLMISRWPEGLMIVLNAACKDADMQILSQNLAGNAKMTYLNEHALIAVQGPSAKQVMSRLGLQLDDMAFMQCREVNISGKQCRLSRCGYTGEDGFEISLPQEHALDLARQLQNDEDCEWIGLGARDSLRLEGGMCLYGHDIDTQTTPIEAALNWAISPVRRKGGEREGGFLGADIILAQMPANITRKRVGFKPEGRAPIREGVELCDQQGQRIGLVTSGGFSPSLNHPIAMGYINKKNARLGTKVYVNLRGKTMILIVSRPDFVANNFYRI